MTVPTINLVTSSGLGINQGRLYRFVAANGETDMATFVNWPASGHVDYPQAGL